MTRVYIVGDPRVFAEALSSRLEFEDDLTVVGGARTAEATIAAIEQGHPNVVVVDFDVSAPGHSVVENLVTKLRERNPGVGVVAILEHEEPDAAVRAVRAGVRGIVTRTAPLSDVVASVRSVGIGDSAVPPRLLTAILESLPYLTVALNAGLQPHSESSAASGR